MKDPICYFLAVYDGATNQASVLEVEDHEAALNAYRTFCREKAELGRNDVDVLLIGAEDLLTLEKLHTVAFTTTTSLSELSRPFDRPMAA